jgi:hypothetical protein
MVSPFLPRVPSIFNIMWGMVMIDDDDDDEEEEEEE